MQAPPPSPSSTYPEPQLFSDAPTVTSLLDALDKYQSDIELDKIERIEEENEMLRKSISSCQRTWYFTVNLLREAFEAMVLLEDSLSNYDKAKKEAKAQWILSFQFKILGSTRQAAMTP